MWGSPFLNCSSSVEKKRTPLHLAAQWNHVEVLQARARQNVWSKGNTWWFLTPKPTKIQILLRCSKLLTTQLCKSSAHAGRFSWKLVADALDGWLAVSTVQVFLYQLAIRTWCLRNFQALLNLLCLLPLCASNDQRIQHQSLTLQRLSIFE